MLCKKSSHPSAPRIVRANQQRNALSANYFSVISSRKSFRNNHKQVRLYVDTKKIIKTKKKIRKKEFIACHSSLKGWKLLKHSKGRGNWLGLPWVCSSGWRAEEEEGRWLYVFCTVRRMDDRVVYSFSAFSVPIWQRKKRWKISEKTKRKEKYNFSSFDYMMQFILALYTPNNE